MSFKEIALSGIMVIVLFFSGAGAISFWKSSQGNLSGEGGRQAQSCTMGTTTRVVVGNQSSVNIVPAYAANATVIIEQPAGATNTVSLGFDSAASANSSFQLSAGNATATVPDRIMLGLDTDLPFVGAVNAITNVGSTTIGVVICKY